MEKKLKKTLDKIPILLTSIERDEESIDAVFSEIKDVIDYDYSLIYYINDERATLKFKKSYEKDKFVEKLDDFVKLNPFLKKSFFNNESGIFDAQSKIVKGLGLEINKSSFIIVKLAIRSVVYGIFVLIKKEENFYNKEDLYIANTLGSVISYAIKDIELSNVFKLQLKTLQENVIEKLNANKKLKEQNEKILESERAKSEFFANMSHELRTPLNSIIGFSESLACKLFGSLTEKQEEYVNDIRVSGIHLLGMINEILDMTKLEANAMKLSLRVVDMVMTVQETINIVQPLADKKNIKLCFKSDKNVTLEVDYQKIQQIMYNLLSNAIKYTPDNGTVDVTLSDNEAEVIICVKDSGIGIDKKYQGKIFGKFVQLENIYTKTGSSTGLGLAITKELVEMHQGRIAVESKVNKGSKFIVYLPKKIIKNDKSL